MRTYGYDANKSQFGVGVGITRKKSLVKTNNGRHRLAAAHVLRLPKIQIRVTHIHSSFFEQTRVSYGTIIKFLEEMKYNTAI